MSKLITFIAFIVLVILTIVNFMIPDPLPLVDELVMVGIDIFLLKKVIEK